MTERVASVTGKRKAPRCELTRGDALIEGNYDAGNVGFEPDSS